MPGGGLLCSPSQVDGLRGMDTCQVEDCFVLSLLLSHVDGLRGMDTCQVEDCFVLSPVTC